MGVGSWSSNSGMSTGTMLVCSSRDFWYSSSATSLFRAKALALSMYTFVLDWISDKSSVRF
eukprot:10237557-Alexandrium_andersonii.AAC.1